MTRLPGHIPANSGATPGVLALQARIALARLGWLKVSAALLLVAGLLAWLWAIPYWHARIDARQTVIASAKQAHLAATDRAPAATPSAASAATNLAHFQATLANPGTTEQPLKAIFALASKADLRIEQAEYKLATDPRGQFQTYQIVLPLHGSYASIRKFSEQVLREMPFVSLDEIAFRRDEVRDDQPQARLRFTLYLAAQPQKATAQPGGGAQ